MRHIVCHGISSYIGEDRNSLVQMSFEDKIVQYYPG